MLFQPDPCRSHPPTRSREGSQTVLTKSGCFRHTGPTEGCRHGFGGTDTCVSCQAPGRPRLGSLTRVGRTGAGHRLLRTHSQGEACVPSPRHGWAYLLPGPLAEDAAGWTGASGAIPGSATGTSRGRSPAWVRACLPQAPQSWAAPDPTAPTKALCLRVDAPSQTLSRDPRGV